jgi:hypothetical protein
LSRQVPCVNRSGGTAGWNSVANLTERLLLHGADFRYAGNMASDRMMQAIGTLERAVTRLEQDVAGLVPADPVTALDQSAARAALRSLDDLIDTLKDRTHG